MKKPLSALVAATLILLAPGLPCYEALGADMNASGHEVPAGGTPLGHVGSTPSSGRIPSSTPDALAAPKSIIPRDLATPTGSVSAEPVPRALLPQHSPANAPASAASNDASERAPAAAGSSHAPPAAAEISLSALARGGGDAAVAAKFFDHSGQNAGSEPALDTLAQEQGAPDQRLEPAAAQPEAKTEAPPAPAWSGSLVDRGTDWLTKYGASGVFTFLQLPQILKNIVNLSAQYEVLRPLVRAFGFVPGDVKLISSLPWMGYSTGILANMLLLGYFASSKMKSAAIVQAVGVITSSFVVTQIFFAGFMPGAAFAVVMPAIAAGLTINYLNFKGKLPAALWKTWDKASGLLGLVVLPQVLWKTFAPARWASLSPGEAALGVGLLLLGLDLSGRMPGWLKAPWKVASAWTATLLFMYGPIAQLMSNYAHPKEMAGISLLTLLLGTFGNMLMLPRAMLEKNVIWFTGSAWAVFVGGWGVMLSMYLGGFVTPAEMLAATIVLPAYVLIAHAINRSRWARKA